jgi:hypothetical protein
MATSIRTSPGWKWVCQTDRSHIFDEPTLDYFCPEEHTDGDFGILLFQELPVPPPPIEVKIKSPKENDGFEEGSAITILVEAGVENGSISKIEFLDNDRRIGEVSSLPYSYSYEVAVVGRHSLTAKAWDVQGSSKMSEATNINIKPAPPTPEVGLCVILMDASSSMTDPAFEGSPLTRMRLVATSAANGIFDLQRMQNNLNAYVALFKFDDRVELMLLETVDKLLNRFDKNEKKFANYLYDELYKMQQGTDINQALMQAHSLVDKFLRKQLPNFPLRRYRPMMQRILKFGGDSVAIPNIRVLIYTDGRQFAHGSKTLHPNPFKEFPLEGLNHDIVIGAFFGNENDEGCRELKSLVSRCPIHDELQFFLFDDPSRISSLKYLFRMASGASGFCPKDLVNELYPIR